MSADHPTPPDDAEARRIAQTLTPAQKRALLLMRPNGIATSAVTVPAKRVLARMPGLAEGWGIRGPGTVSYAATAFGLRVRAILQEADHAGA